MSRRLVIQPVTRIEGHAKVSIELNDAGEVASARLHVAEFRGFEKLCQGRPFYEMPILMSRVCGICPVSHVLASSKAGDALLGVEPPPAAIKQRRLANYAQILQSHALSFFHLAAPDLLLGMDAPAAKRSLFGLLESPRLIEILHCAERIDEAICDPELFGEDVQAKAGLNHREGVGSCEAPRGTLFHRYQTDRDGLVTDADLLIATAQNNRAMNLAVEQAARHFLGLLHVDASPSDGMLNRIEAAIRCYDPCLSCSTHALGCLPLVVEIFDARGTLQWRIYREE